MMLKRTRVFYGWYIVAVAIIGMGLTYGIRNSFSVFFQPILNQFQWNRGSTAIMLSLNIFIYGLAAPVAGTLADRWDAKKVVIIGTVILSLATGLCAFASQLWHFYLLFGILSPVGTALCGSPMFYPTVTNWFARRREMAIGLTQIGGGLSFAYSMLTESIISLVGWQYAYAIMAGILVVVLVPLYYLFFFGRPGDKGMLPLGGVISGDSKKEKSAAAATLPEWTLGGALKTRQLWLLFLSNFFFWGIGNYLVLAHQIKFSQDIGYSSGFAATIFALFGIISIVGQVCAPISSRIGRELTATLGVVLAIGGMLALISVKDTSQPWLLYIYAIGCGYAAGIFSPTLIVGVADIFYGKNFGAINSLMLTGMGFGGAIGPWLGGYIYDNWHSYTAAFYICMAGFALSCLCFWLAAPRNYTRLNRN